MKPILIHIHIYYTHLWPELRECVELVDSLNLQFQLVITTVGEMTKLADEVTTRWPEAELRVVPNLGYDIAPFAEVLNHVDLTRYRYCIKLHTKRDVVWDASIGAVCVGGNRWRQYLLSFMKRENMEAVLRAFESQPTLGMVGHHALICSREPYDEHAWKLSEHWLNTGGFALSSSTYAHKYIAGSMFMCRAELLGVVRDILKGKEFEMPKPERISPISHAAERLLGHAVTAAGYEVRDVYTPAIERMGFRWKHLLLRSVHRLMRFVFQRKRTKSGKLIVKICKIPVYYE